MAGAGSRFTQEGYELPKPLIDIAGLPMIQRCINSLDITGQYIFIIRKYETLAETILLRDILKQITEEPIIIEIDHVTEGAACTCLLAKEHINNSEQLISVNCDQIMNWDSKEFLNLVEGANVDGCVVTYNSDSIKNSYIELDEQGFGVRLAEKDPISNLSLTGIHYWKQGRYFVKSAEAMINDNIRVNNEFYVAPTYNHMISDGLKVNNYHIENSNFHPVGTPEDLKKYLHSHYGIEK